MKNRFVALMLGLVFISVILGSCRIFQDSLHQPITATPAPTAIPLPTHQPTPSPTTTPTQTPQPAEPVQQEMPSPVPSVTEPSVTVMPTRVRLPEEPILLPAEFGISVFADNLKGPRMMVVGPDNVLYVAERGANRILRLPDRDNDGLVDGIEVAADGLNAPSSVAFHPDGSLYVGETRRVLRLQDPDGDGLFQEQEVIVNGLPSGGHSTRTVLFSTDGMDMYVSIGSSCNVCVEDDPRRAAIVRYAPDGSGETLFATGLRNAVGLTFRPGTDEFWATNNGRDWLGDDQPPETVYLVREGDDAGWPYCHAGRIEDPDYGTPGSCNGILSPMVEMQAHSAPLGLTFYTGDQFPPEYQDDLFVAFHGSWNRTESTGYKVVRVPLDGESVGPVEDFASGWLREDGSQWGRPVDVITGPDGSLYISDDGRGRIYRVFYTGE
jgi:glucose/arabinose dehydrogenase